MKKCKVCKKIIWFNPIRIHLKYFFGSVHKRCEEKAFQIENEQFEHYRWLNKDVRRNNI